MIEGARLIIDVGAQVPEILQHDFAIQLGEQHLAIATKVVFGERAERHVVVLEPGARLRLTVDHPGEGIAAVGIPEPPRIVGIIRGRLPAVLQIVQPVALGLSPPQQRRRSGERGSRRIVVDVARVGPLEIVHRRALHAVDRRRVAAQVREPEPATQLVRATVPAENPVRAAGVRAARVGRCEQAVEIALHGRERHAHHRFRRAEFLLQARHAVSRRRRDDGAAKRARGRIERARRFAPRDGRQDAQRRPAGKPARDLGCAQDGRVLGTVDEVAARVARWTRANPPGIEVARPVAAQQLVALGEEGPALVEEDLERREVDDRRIGLDLAEVGVDGAVERNVGTETHLEVRAGAGREIGAAVERVRRGDVALQARVRRRVRHQFEAARRLDPLNADQLTHERRPTRAIPGDRNPEDIFAGRGIPVVDVEAPHLDRLVRKAQLRKRDPHFRRPSEAVDGGFRFPHGVEPPINDVLVVGGVIPIEPHAGGGDSEGVRRAPIVVAVE